MSTNIKTNGTRKFAVLDLPGVVQKSTAVAAPAAVVNIVESIKEAVAAAPKAKTAAPAPASEEHLYKSVLSIEERVAVAMSVGEEVVTEEELTAMYKG